MTSGATQKAHVLVRSEHPRGHYAARRLRSTAGHFLKALRRRDELSVLVTTDRGITGLNRQWRSKDRPTDVLSFGAGADSGLLGDVVISLDTARRQARERSMPLADELDRLLAHGLLHLLGHDHEVPAEARRMAQAETALLGTVGLVGESLAASPATLEFSRVRLGRAAARSTEKRS